MRYACQQKSRYKLLLPRYRTMKCNRYELLLQLSIDPFNPFATETGLRLNHTLTRTLHFNVGTDDVEVEVKYVEPEVYSMRVNKIGPWRTVSGTLQKRNKSLELCTEIDGKIAKASVTKIHNKLHLFTKVTFLR